MGEFSFTLLVMTAAVLLIWLVVDGLAMTRHLRWPEWSGEEDEE